MALNCRPNDLAITVETQLLVNSGILVRVVRRHVNSPEWNFGDLPVWWCTSELPMTWRFPKLGRVISTHEGPIPDRCLRPIRPARLAEEESRPCVETA